MKQQELAVTVLSEETAMLMKEVANSSAENECLSFKGKA